MRFNAMQSLCAGLVAGVVWSPIALGAQTPVAPSAPNILRVGGTTVEVLGLRRWTVPMLQDSLAKYAPGDSLHTDGCAAALRYTLGFADAAVMWHDTGVGRTHTLIVLREPQDSALVRYRPASFDTTGNLARYAALLALHQANPRAFGRALASYPLHRAGRFPQPDAGPDAPAVRSVWQELGRHATDAERHRATRTLESDPSLYDRMMAAAVLANFPQHDATWHALVGAMLESDGLVKGVAANLLRNMSVAHRRTVDWAPSLRAIRAMMDGTALFQTNALLEALVNTGIARHLAPALLAGEDPIVFHLAAGSLPSARLPARAFLTYLSGADHGDDVEAWRRWRMGLYPAVHRTGVAR